MFLFQLLTATLTVVDFCSSDNKNNPIRLFTTLLCALVNRIAKFFLEKNLFKRQAQDNKGTKQDEEIQLQRQCYGRVKKHSDKLGTGQEWLRVKLDFIYIG